MTIENGTAIVHWPHVSRLDAYQGMTQRGYALYTIEQAMMRVMWDNHNVNDDRASPLTLSFSGAPTEWYSYLAHQD
jgi:hypothetical protein